MELSDKNVCELSLYISEFMSLDLEVQLELTLVHIFKWTYSALNPNCIMFDVCQKCGSECRFFMLLSSHAQLK